MGSTAAAISESPSNGVREYVPVRNEFGSVDGVLRRGRRPSRVVVIQTHPRRDSADNFGAWPLEDLVPFGVDTFGFNNRVTNSAAGTEVTTVWEPLALDVAAAVQEMRDQGYREVILYGWSAAGPLMSYYQAVAEAGNAAFEPGRSLSGFPGFFRNGREWRLPAADGIIVQNSTTGTAPSFATRLDGSIVDEATGTRDPTLDPFSAENGYDGTQGTASYGQEFLARYFAAQARRMNGLIAQARERQLASVRGKALFTDHAIMVIPGTRAELACVDLHLASATARAYELLPSGATTRVRSTRRPVEGYARRNRRFRDGGTVHTVESFLSYRAIAMDPDVYRGYATDPDATGMDLGSSNSTTAANIARVTVPLLITAGSADPEVHLGAAELMYNAARQTSDRTLAFVHGAVHEMTPVSEGIGDTRRVHLTRLATWLVDRYHVSD